MKEKTFNLIDAIVREGLDNAHWGGAAKIAILKKCLERKKVSSCKDNSPMYIEPQMKYCVSLASTSPRSQ